MSIELLKEGFLLMIIGMGFVFFFLAILIVIMNLNSKIMNILNRYFPEIVEEDSKPVKKKSQNNEDEIALAIACAIAKKQNIL